MSGDHRDLAWWREEYRRRAELDPLKAVFDAGDVDGLKNAYTDVVERVHLQRLLRRFASGVSLDLGCGVGRLAPMLAARSHRVLAFDFSPQMLAAARRRRPPANVEFCCSDARQLPVADGEVDLVVACGVLIHFLRERDLGDVAAEVVRVLSPHGSVVLIEHVAVGAEYESNGIAYRSIDGLLAPFQKLGLRVVVSRPLRKMPSLIVHWVRMRYVPRVLWRLAARFEPWHARHADPLTTYRDQLVLLERPNTDGGPR